MKLKSQQNGFNEFLITSSALVPFYSISFPLFGFQVSFFKLIPFIISIFYLRISNFKIPKNIFFSISYFIFISIIFYFIANLGNKFEYLINLGRNPKTAFLNPIVQSMLFITSVFQIWFISKKSLIDNVKILSTFIYSSLFLNLIGYIQIIFYQIGLPWFKYWFLIDAFQRSESKDLAGGKDLSFLAETTSFFRMSSLGGEPRHFASILALAIIILLYLRSKEIKLNLISGKYGLFSIVFFISGIFFSFSSSGVLILFISGSTYLFLKKRFMFFYLALFFIILYFTISLNFIFDFYWKLSDLKTILYAAPKDYFALKAVFDNFTNFIFGYGISMAELFKPELYLFQDTPFGLRSRLSDPNPMSGVIVPTSPFIQFLANGGLIGFSLFLNNLKALLIKYEKNTVEFIIIILSLTLVSSGLMLSMGFFLISIILNFESKNNNSFLKNK